MSDGVVLELFGGPGGLSEGMRMLGIRNHVGLELDKWACATRAAAGHRTVRCDVAQFGLSRIGCKVCAVVGSPVCISFSAAGKRGGVALLGVLEVLIRELLAGRATRAVRRREMARLLRASSWAADAPPRLDAYAWQRDYQSAFKRRLLARKGSPRALERGITATATPGRLTRAERSAAIWQTVRSASLVAEPARYIAACRPEWVALEQVPAVLPLWQVYAEELRKMGYSAWCGLLNSADYGVPQTRIRAILIASRVRQVSRPVPTHYDPRKGMQLFGSPWVSMAEALGWGADGRPSPAVTAGGTSTGGAEPFGHRDRQALESERDSGRWALRIDAQANASVRDVTAPAPALKFGHSAANMQWVLHTNRGQDKAGNRQTADPQTAPAPAPALTAKSGNQWILRNNNNNNACSRSLDEPAGTLFFGGRSNWAAWVHERPATSVMGDPRLGWPGHKGRGSGGESHFAVDSVRITPEEAAALQSFPPGYPFKGTKTAIFTQIGNAVPPLLAAHVLAMATGISAESIAA